MCEEEPGLLGIGAEPSIAIGQRALLVCTEQGNLLWDCVSMVDEAGRDRIAQAGGIDAICISHPHFYGANVDLADAFDATIHLPHADGDWIQHPSRRIELFDDTVEPVPGLTVARIGGHFDGAAVAHWPAGADGRGALLTGDTITVVQDREWVSFMWSYPNLVPLDEATVLDIADRVEPFTFDRVYGGWWGSSSRTAPQRCAAPPIATSPGCVASAPPTTTPHQPGRPGPGRPRATARDPVD